jgi:pyruvate-formate lyase-activating enzyme
MTGNGDNLQVRSGFLPDRIVHLHPTRLCNLACLHCYSESGPKEKTSLSLEELQRALLVLRAEGYAQISLSGGEPMVYAPLVPLIDFAHACGFRVTMITNGLFTNKKVDDVAKRLDGIAISFDGLARTHNYLRGREDAFDRSCAALARFAESDHPISAAISLTREAIPELPELTDTLVALGARALQVRPVALAGRARTLTGLNNYTAIDHARLFLVVSALREELGDGVRIHCDLAPTLHLWHQRDTYGALLASCDLDDSSASARYPLSDLINPLVITEVGALKPIAYDFNPEFDVATLADLSPEMLESYKRTRLPHFQTLIGQALASLEMKNGFVDWFDYCTRLSEEHACEKALHTASN